MSAQRTQARSSVAVWSRGAAPLCQSSALPPLFNPGAVATADMVYNAP
jgi:hypothetical protein